jgi:hypothetical protein
MLPYHDRDTVQAMESGLLRGGGSCSAVSLDGHCPLAPTQLVAQGTALSALGSIYISRDKVDIISSCEPDEELRHSYSAPTITSPIAP